MNTRKLSISLAAAAGVLLLAGCASAPGPSVSVASAGRASVDEATVNNGSAVLHKGMTAEDVLVQWGEPATVEKVGPPIARAEVWTYHHVVNARVADVVARMQPTPRYNVFAQRIEMVDEPVFDQEFTRVEQTVKLLLIADTLAEWKQTQDEYRTIN